MKIKPGDLNYHYYSMEKYDMDIINSIPYHKKIHESIKKYILKNYDKKEKYLILDLGVGTGITSRLVKDLLPNSEFNVVDFSDNMLSNAKKKLGKKNVIYILGDYTKLHFNKKYDIIISVIGLHHQNNTGKKFMFKRIYSLLNKDGVLIFGDLVTYKNKKIAESNDFRHFYHLKKNITDDKTLEEWLYHHKCLNKLAPIEDQITWLRNIGFKVKKEFLKYNTCLLICTKN